MNTYHLLALAALSPLLPLACIVLNLAAGGPKGSTKGERVGAVVVLVVGYVLFVAFTLNLPTLLDL